MLFALLQEKLLALIRDRVKAGELTERGLALATGISQPHLHNALKGIRSLSGSYADQLILHLNLQIADLMGEREIQSKSTVFIAKNNKIIPYFGGFAGPGCRVDQSSGREPVLKVVPDLANRLDDPAFVILAHDPLLYPHFQAGDTALISRERIDAKTLDHSAAYLMEAKGSTLLRWLRTGGNRLYLLTPATAGEPRKWESLPVESHRVADVILGRVVWIGRELQANSQEAPAGGT